MIHRSVRTIVVSFSTHLTYDRILKQSDNGFFKAYYLTLKAGGIATIDFSGRESGTGYVTSMDATALTGKGRNHLEVALGLGYLIDTDNLIDLGDPDPDLDESTFYANISVGYRKQTAKSFMFRTRLVL